jgi:hypothetical protein
MIHVSASAVEIDEVCFIDDHKKKPSFGSVAKDNALCVRDYEFKIWMRSLWIIMKFKS